MNIIEELKWRGLLNDATDIEKLEENIKSSITLYCGVDPTADSMHIGHLLPILVLKRFQMMGHKPIAVIGGATGMIGDPSGRNSERVLLNDDVITNNVEKLTVQLKNILNYNDESIIVNNYDWTSNINVIEFLRNYGKHFSVNTMLAKDSVSSRIETGISFTEFSYSLLQSIDYLKLYENYNCVLQIGGSDQWGNITSGLELIRKKHGETACTGLTIPLVTKSDGSKFGKTASGAVWLDDKYTSPYEMYQFLLNTTDEDVIKYLKYFTFLSKAEIEKLEECVKNEAHLRQAQKTLAYEVTNLVHGEEKASSAIRISEALFTSSLTKLTNEEIHEGFKDVLVCSVNNEQNIIDVMIENKLLNGKRDARELVSGNAISVNGIVLTDIDKLFSDFEAVNSKYYLVKRGKKKYYLFEVI